jgi:hypothetical protein
MTQAELFIMFCSDLDGHVRKWKAAGKITTLKEQGNDDIGLRINTLL